MAQDSEFFPIPDHHKQWFETLAHAFKHGRVALISCIDAKTHEPRSVIAVMNSKIEDDMELIPIGHLCTEDNPYDAYIPPMTEGGMVS